jgi:LuxR family maltose regulon positive regulatory protein
MAAFSGQQDEMARLLAQLSTLTSNGALPDGTKSVESVVALIRGLFGFGGPSDMLESARRASELETDGNTPWYAVATTALGHASYVIGDLDTAARVLPNAAYGEAAPSLIRIMALASLSLTQAELGQFDRSRKSAEESMEVVEARSLRALPSGSMAYTALGQSQAASGQLTEAMVTLEQGLSLLRKNPGVSPWPMIHHLLVIGRVAIMSGDLPLARRLLDDVARLMRQYQQGMSDQQGMSAMIARLDVAQRSLRQGHVEGPHTEALTGREIDVLRRLAGSLSIGEIASELYLSPNTVKTHTTALYRKLGARSRSEAVKIGRERLLI